VGVVGLGSNVRVLDVGSGLGGLPPLGFHLLLGPDFQMMAQNQKRNLEEGRVALVQMVAKK
jgi:hypothetical protein